MEADEEAEKIGLNADWLRKFGEHPKVTATAPCNL
jgi:hypothetical protein